MLKIARNILAIVVIILGAYGFIDKNVWFQPLIFLFLGLAMLVIGIEKSRAQRRTDAWLSFVGFVVSLSVAVFSALY